MRDDKDDSKNEVKEIYIDSENFNITKILLDPEKENIIIIERNKYKGSE